MARTDIEVPAEDQRGWPEPWLASRGLSGDDLLTHGATHTVAELIAAASKGPLTARLQGHCSGYVGPVEFDGAYFGIRTFTDSSGSVKVLQPVSLEVIGAGDSMVEVEVECPGPIGPPHEPPDTPLVEEAVALAASDDPSAAIDAMVDRLFGDVENAPRIRRMTALQ